MAQCPQCGIGRKDISTPCSICGYKPAAEDAELSAQAPRAAEEKSRESRSTIEAPPEYDWDSTPATEKQIAYIKALGGKPKPGLTKGAASELIDRLRSSAPPTQKQLDLLKTLGAQIPRKLTSEQASELISRLDGEQPPTKQQIKYIKMLGGEVPATKREASQQCNTLPQTAPATRQQRKQADELCVSLPGSATFSQANQLLGDAEMDADPEEGKPPTKAQLNKIAKLGGDPEKASNRWRADEYIDELEEKVEQSQDRIDEAVEWMFGDAESRSMMSVKKPSKAVMKKAILFGESQGWGEGWEDPGGDSDLNPYSLMDFAVYSVSPELLKSGESPPRMPTPGRATSPKGRGCLLVAAAIISAPLVIWRLIT